MKQISHQSMVLSWTKNVAVLSLFIGGLVTLSGCASQGNEAAVDRPTNSVTTVELATAKKPVTTTITTSNNGMSTVTQNHLPTASAPGYTTTTTTQARGN